MERRQGRGSELDLNDALEGRLGGLAVEEGMGKDEQRNPGLEVVRPLW